MSELVVDRPELDAFVSVEYETLSDSSLELILGLTCFLFGCFAPFCCFSSFACFSFFDSVLPILPFKIGKNLIAFSLGQCIAQKHLLIMAICHYFICIQKLNNLVGIVTEKQFSFDNWDEIDTVSMNVSPPAFWNFIFLIQALEKFQRTGVNRFNHSSRYFRRKSFLRA